MNFKKKLELWVIVKIMEKISYTTGDRKDRVTAVTQAVDVAEQVGNFMYLEKPSQLMNRVINVL